jgi:hypothetical protein
LLRDSAAPHADGSPQLIDATKPFFGVRKIRRCGRHRHSSAYAKSVGAGLLANAVSQATDALRQDRLRGQARSYEKSRLSALRFEAIAEHFVFGGRKKALEKRAFYSAHGVLSAYSTTLGSHSEIAGM